MEGNPQRLLVVVVEKVQGGPEHANDEDGGGHVDVDVLTVEVEDMLKVGGSKISMFWWHLVARRGMGSGIAPGLGIGRKQGGDGISTGLSLQEGAVSR